MSSQEAVHVSPTAVTPAWGKGALDIGGVLVSGVAGLIKPAQRYRWPGYEAVGKPWKMGCMRTSA
jgi:hypothetical protein